MESAGKGLLSRRSFLKGITAAGAASALSATLPSAALAAPTRRVGVTVFRLSTRNTRACNACKQHHRYKVFISHAAADRNRAHPGCNCPITKQKMPRRTFARLFLDTRAIRTGVADLRHMRGPVIGPPPIDRPRIPDVQLPPIDWQPLFEGQLPPVGRGL